MTDWSQRITVSANDGYEIPADTPNITAAYLEAGDHGGSVTTAMRFTNVTVPAGATVSAATLTLTGRDTYNSGTAMNVSVGCEDVDNSAALTGSDGNLAGRAASITSATTAFAVRAISQDTEYNIAITTAVAEVLARAGWASGNTLTVLIVDSTCPNQEWQQFYSVDGSGAKAPLLSITYTAAGGGGIVIPTIMHQYRQRRQ